LQEPFIGADSKILKIRRFAATTQTAWLNQEAEFTFSSGLVGAEVLQMGGFPEADFWPRIVF
jgi:hypothetical protein